MSRKSNPIDYHLNKVRLDVNLHLSSLRKQVKLIFRSLMKRLRAAYVYKNKEIETSPTLNVQHELRMWASRCTGYEEDVNEKFNEIMDALKPTHTWVTHSRGTFDVRNIDTIANNRIDDCNRGIEMAEAYVKRVEDHAFSTPRGQTKDRSGFTEREHVLYQARILRKNLNALLLELKANYPYIREKYRARLAKLIVATMVDEDTHGGKTRMPMPIFRAASYTMDTLVKIGIPASDVVGPWWTHTQSIKSPMGYITTDGSRMPLGYYDWKSPTPEAWLSNIGLDGQDHLLVASVRNYYNHHKVIPSVEWARQRNNEIEEERRQTHTQRKIAPVKQWLEASEFWRSSSEFIEQNGFPTVPPLLNQWRVVTPADAKTLCERAARDGMCVADVLNHLVYRASEHVENHGEEGEEDRDFLWHLFKSSAGEGVVTLLFSTDPKRRTIVGLDENGVCTSEHHCTGKDNKLDEEAWERFKS